MKIKKIYGKCPGCDKAQDWEFKQNWRTWYFLEICIDCKNAVDLNEITEEKIKTEQNREIVFKQK